MSLYPDGDPTVLIS